jgi:dimethylhistidine N-methyltransferase
MELQSFETQQTSEHVSSLSVMMKELQDGLHQNPMRIPSKYLYDKEGSRLFDEICKLEEYYPTRKEIEILKSMRSILPSLLGNNVLLIELGSGAGIKIRQLLDCAPSRVGYMPVDISREYMLDACERLREVYPSLPVFPVTTDYTHLQSFPDISHLGFSKRIVFFPGSTIGNMEREEAVHFLSYWEQVMAPGDLFLIGVDTKKDISTLERAYNDTRGVTAAFNRNVLYRLNREFGTDFEPELFQHHALFDRECARIEMRLVAQQKMTVHLEGEDFHFEKDDFIHTENSYKYSPDEFRVLARMAGFEPTMLWTDNEGFFSVHCLSKTQS